MRWVLLLGLFAAAVITLVVVTTGSVTSVAAATASVSLVDDAYSPDSITIDVGDTVLWTWTGVDDHTVSSDTSEAFDSGLPKSTGTFSHIFNTAGTFTYLCGVHGLAMTGMVIVQAAPPTSTPAPPTNTAVAATNTPRPTNTPGGETSTPEPATPTPIGSVTAVATVALSAPAATLAASDGPASPTRAAVAAALPRAGSGATPEGRAGTWLWASIVGFLLAAVALSAFAVRRRA